MTDEAEEMSTDVTFAATAGRRPGQLLRQPGKPAPSHHRQRNTQEERGRGGAGIGA